VSRALSGEPESWDRVAQVTRRLLDDDDPLIREAGAQLIHDTQGETGERVALLVGLLADDDDAVVLTAAHALQATPSAAIAADAVTALAAHHHPEARRLAGELRSRKASERPAEDPSGP
jgi:HEAT repeat protein